MPTCKNIKTAIAKPIVMAVCLLLCFVLLYGSPLGKYLNLSQVEKLRAELQYYSVWAPLVFFVVGSLAIGAGFPRTVAAFLAGAVFGFWQGVILAEATAVAGSFIVFLTVRWAREAFLQKIIAAHLERVDAYIRKHGFASIFLLRQLPVPGFFVNILTGLSAVSVLTFLAASALGFLPQTLIFVLYGCGLQQNFVLPVTLASSLLIIFSVALYFLYQRSELARNLISHTNPKDL
jgi:uncharacterized membrane protein YdjX (TVP38/TMEM64 family)